MDITELDALLDEAKPAAAELKFCLRGDLQVEWERLDTELTELRQRSVNTLAGNNPAEAELAESIGALEAKMASSTVTVRLESVGRRPWRELVAGHPPREEHAGDRVVGHNQETFYDALVAACMVQPDLDGERMERFLDKLTPYQYDLLTNTAWGLNRRDVAVPFSHTASLINTRSGATSRPQSDSASATAASPAGSRRKSPSTSTTKTLA